MIHWPCQQRWLTQKGLELLNRGSLGCIAHDAASVRVSTWMPSRWGGWPIILSRLPSSSCWANLWVGNHDIWTVGLSMLVHQWREIFWYRGAEENGRSHSADHRWSKPPYCKSSQECLKLCLFFRCLMSVCWNFGKAPVKKEKWSSNSATSAEMRDAIIWLFSSAVSAPAIFFSFRDTIRWMDLK